MNVRPAPGAFEKAREAAEQSVEWLSLVRPEHLEGFWYNGTSSLQLLLTLASRNNLVLLGTFITLLQSVAFTSADRDGMQKLWERLKWQLRIFSRGNELFEGALRRADDKRSWITPILEKGFVPVSLAKHRHRPVQRVETPYVPLEGSTMTGFPDFSAQSMEDLLHGEGLAQQNAEEFPEGFLGFEEFSGWEGFDINNL
jgi:hypothetical protein